MGAYVIALSLLSKPGLDLFLFPAHNPLQKFVQPPLTARDQVDGPKVCFVYHPYPPPGRTLKVAHHERGSGERRGEEHRDMEGQEADQTPRGSSWKWDVHDLVDYP
ncbi:eukaryotic peptide chain release factor subunit 1 [Emergomyces africanus]|uniref:Eukaryotic peptide chain release factor subunit 1 n=1 Tax=Emergomyces africanus TaxID=1955775 RepID=A0A1B7NKN1_9EURO|nr:eukaryotic peptide chain release factor subunit 1 [Emergomyces africanus]